MSSRGCDVREGADRVTDWCGAGRSSVCPPEEFFTVPVAAEAEQGGRVRGTSAPLGMSVQAQTVLVAAQHPDF